jgi:predicted component of type VI protein secretion system
MRLAACVVAALLVAGCGRSAAQPQPDPAVRVAAAVLALERSPTRLSPEQARRALPVLEALRDLRPEEREAARALAAQFDALLTPAQRDSLRAARERFRERIGGGPRRTPDPQRLAEFRRRLLDRAVTVLRMRAQGR